MGMTIVVALIGIGILLCAYRMVKGPSPFDRIVSLDTINMIIVGLICVLAVIFESGLYLDIAIVYGVLSFLETVVIARYMEGRR